MSFDCTLATLAFVQDKVYTLERTTFSGLARSEPVVVQVTRKGDYDSGKEGLDILYDCNPRIIVWSVAVVQNEAVALISCKRAFVMISAVLNVANETVVSFSVKGGVSCSWNQAFPFGCLPALTILRRMSLQEWRVS